MSRKDALDAVAFQSTLLALSAAIEAAGAAAKSSFAMAELRHLAQVAKQTANRNEPPPSGSPQG